MFEFITELSFLRGIIYLLLFLSIYSFFISFFVYRKTIKDYKNKHVLITGGSAGLGKSLAIKLAKKGARITIIARNKEKLQQAKEEIEAASDSSLKVVAISANVGSFQEIDQAIQQSIKEQGEIDILIANAGSSFPSYFADTGVEIYEKEVQLNYLGTLYSVKSSLPCMINRKKGHIIIVSSAIAYNTFIGYSNYSATKFALKGLADSLRNELILYGIGVTIFCPANIDTDGFKEEQKTKPKETKEIEGISVLQNPDETSDSLLKGLEKGVYCITNEFFPSGFLRSISTPLFVPRENLLLDIIVSPIFVTLSPIFNIIYDGIVKKSRKERAVGRKNE